MDGTQAGMRQKHGCQQDHAQRPKVVHQIGLHRRRVAQRDKEQKVKAKQAINPQRQGAGGQAKAAQGLLACSAGRGTAQQLPAGQGQAQCAACQQAQAG